MAILTYGGIVIQVQKTHTISTEDVYDDTGLDLLWTRWTFDVTGLINFAATSYVSQQGNPDPQAGRRLVLPGNPPFLTIQTIRDTLSQPRQPLTYADENGNVLVQSPGFAPVAVNGFAPGAGILRNFLQPPQLLDCDCDGGPKPLSPVQILGVHGSGKSVIVRFKGQHDHQRQHLLDSPGRFDQLARTGAAAFGAQASGHPQQPLVVHGDNRQPCLHDAHAFRPRRLSRRLAARHHRPAGGWWSGATGCPGRLPGLHDGPSHPAGVPAAKQVVVEQEPDGFAVKYRVTDVQMPMTLLSNTACEIKVIQTESIGYYGHEQWFTEGNARRWMLLKAASLAEAASFDPFHDAGMWHWGPSSGSNRFAVQSVARSVPRFSTNLAIEVIGQPASNRKDLAGLAYEMCSTKS